MERLTVQENIQNQQKDNTLTENTFSDKRKILCAKKIRPI